MTQTIGESGLIDVWAATGLREDAPSEKKNAGWNAGEQPPARYVNATLNEIGAKLNLLLRNSGAPWHDEISYIAGNLVSFNGETYRAIAPNTNTSPPDPSTWIRFQPDLRDTQVADLSGATVTRANGANGDLIVNQTGTGRIDLNGGSGLFRDGNAILDTRNLNDFRPAGTFVFSGKNAPPVGALVCNGAAISRTVYSELFAEIGTDWGEGDGSTTFNLPTGYGAALRGFDPTGVIDPGRVFGTLQLDAIQDHRHYFKDVDVDSFNGNGDDPDWAAQRRANGDSTELNGRDPDFISGSVSAQLLARVAAETRMRNITGLICMWY